MPAAVAEKQPLRWWIPLIEGIAAIIIGIFFLTNPLETSLVFVLALGIYWLIIGVMDIIRIFIDRQNWGWKLFSGIIAILAGLLIIGGFRQGDPLRVALNLGELTVIIIGILGIVYGVIGLVQAFAGGGWWMGIIAVVAMIFGVIMLYRPVIMTMSLPWALGFLLIGGGVFLIVVAFRMR